MNISTIAVDLDGTLLDQHGYVAPQTKSALQDASKSGYDILLCTGRHHNDACLVARETDVDMAVIACNGAYTADKTGHAIDVKALDSERIALIYNEIRRVRLDPIIYTVDGIFVSPACPVAVWYRNRNKETGNALGLMISEQEPEQILTGDVPILKISAHSDDRDRLDSLCRALEANGIQGTTSSPQNREFMAPGVSKKNALNRYLIQNGREFGQVMAIGDSENDIDMIRAAGCGVVMGNADRRLTGLTAYRTLSNHEHGVAYAISALCEGNLNRLQTCSVYM